MTSPTGPDRDRLRASDAGQDDPEHICLSCGLRGRHGRNCPAPQQPPAQERPNPEAAVWDPETETLRWPPSEADSAGEDGRLRILVFLSTLFGAGHSWPRSGQTRQEMTEASVELVRAFVRSETALAASSGVRGGDDQARERLADVREVIAEMGRYQTKGNDGLLFGRWWQRLHDAAGGQL